MAAKPLLRSTERGLYCEAGDFFVDPWRPVDRAVITHGHSDHARWGSKHYLCSPTCREILRVRLGADINVETVPFGQAVEMNGVKVSLHPAGHLLGSAQVRVEHRGEVWVVSGDYKTQGDRTCEQFEPVRCNTFITESTFGLPIYRWRAQEVVMGEINDWWRGNQERGWTSVLFAYALGKAQRILGGVDASIGPILVHGAVLPLNEAYRQGGVALPQVEYATVEAAKAHKGKALVIAPLSASGTPWLKKFVPYSLAAASGWMQVRGARRRSAMDRGFVLSDHADWKGILETIEATGAEWVGVTHGYAGQMARYLNETGRSAFTISTQYEGEVEDSAEIGAVE